MTRVWCHFAWRDGRAAKNAIAEALKDAGVESCALGTGPLSGPGVIFFRVVNQEICEQLLDRSRNGRERVLAVAVSPSALTGGGAWRVLQAGASDVLAWREPHNSARDVAARLKRWEMIDSLLRSPLVRENVVGDCPEWIAALRRVVEVARFTDASLLIAGESGTGKERIAHLIHQLDPRPQKRDLVILDCTTIVPELSGSEFFGHERGAFTGAVAARDGAFALADGGTLFLDEVGELPLGLQAQLLRVVEEHVFKRVGGNTWHKTNFRLVCATNRDLVQEVKRGRFRRDLYYRIASWVISLPRLNDRREDILPLVHHFLREFRLGEDPPALDESVREYLLGRDYPGNVRDLRQLCARISQLHVGSGPFTIGAVPEEERKLRAFVPGDWQRGPFEHAIRRAIECGTGLEEIGRIATDTASRIAIQDANNNLPQAAKKLKVTARALQMRRKKGQRVRAEDK